MAKTGETITTKKFRKRQNLRELTAKTPLKLTDIDHTQNLTALILHATISLLAEDTSIRSSTLIEIADDFLSGLSPQDREETQTEVYKFIRWLGSARKANEISPVDVASYGELVAPAATKPVKTFLKYIQKKGFTSMNLAPHFKARRVSSKRGAVRQRPQIQAMLTEQGLAKLKEELVNLKAQLPDVVEEMQRAALDKDFRENAPLHAARERKSHLERRIKELESTLESAKLMEESQFISRVRIGDTVVLRDLSSDREVSYVLVGPQEANPIKSKISTASPLGKVLLDKEKEQTVEVAAPAGTFYYRIEAVLGPNEQR